MSSTQRYIVKTPITDFTNAVPFNFDIWRDQVAAAAFTSFPIITFLAATAEVQAMWLVDPSGADKTLYANLIPLHLGGNPDDSPQRVFSTDNAGDVDATTSSAVQVLELVKASPLKGVYQVSFNMMFLMVAEVASARAIASISIDLGAGYVLRQFSSNRFTEQASWGLSFPVERLAGQVLGVRLHIARMGGASGTARALRLVPSATTPACAITIDRLD